MPSPAQSSRSWCFTLNNPDGAIDFAELPYCRYGIAQLEIADSGTVHYQGYVELTRTVRLSHMRTWLNGAHFEPRKGTRDEARNYCRKPETQLEPPIEFGDWGTGSQGRRMDILALKSAVDQGATLEKVWDLYPLEFLKYNRGIQLATVLKTKPRSWKTRVTILYGPTGTGKSKWVYDNFPATDVYPKQRSNWWCGYQGQGTILLDDFYGWLPFDEMLRLMDRYPMLLQTKGGQTQMLAKELIITSNKQPYEWYNNDKIRMNMEAFYRRVDRWILVPERDTFLEFSDQFDFETAVSRSNINY